MVETNLLKGRIAMAGLTQGVVANRMKMGANTFSAKVNGKSPFDVDEVVLLCKILNITEDREKIEIFLPETSR